MTVSHRAAPRWTVLVPFAALCASALSCKHDPNRVAGYVAAIDELQAALCQCKADALACEGEDLVSECHQRVVHEHEDQIASWLECATEETRARAACARDTDCADDPLETCGGLQVSDACGDMPEGPSMAIEQAIDQQCGEPIECDDGSTVRGGFCNGRQECRDGSDESSCDDGAPATAGVASPASAPPPPPSTLPMPVSDAGAGAPQPGACTATRTTLEVFGASCISCACDAAAFEAAACDETCWSLLACAAQRCKGLGGGAEQSQCVAESCAEHLAGAEAASKLGPILQLSCADVCPSP